MHTFVIVKTLVVNTTGQILAIRRSQTDTRRPGQWDFPGGWLDDGEDVLRACVRECKEEVGLAVSDLQIIYAATDMTTSGDSCTWITARARLASQADIKLSYEHDAYKWFAPKTLLKELTYDPQLTMLRYVVGHDLLRE